MDCVTFSDEWLPGLTDLINAHIAQVPPGWTVTEQQVAAVLATPALWNVHYPDEPVGFEMETRCVVADGRLVAAAQWCYPAQRGEGSFKGVVSWIVGVPEEAAALSLLLETLTVHSRARGCCALGIGRYAFGVGWMGVPTLWPHLVAGFEQAGFSCFHCWVMMMGTTDVPVLAAPECATPMCLAWCADEAALEWGLRLCDGDQLIGECQAWGVPWHLAGCDGYAEWITVEWLGVEPPYQRQGIGRWLLSEQLRRQAQRGIRKAVFWTEPDNVAALCVGESLGFRRGPECWGFEKAIG